MAEAVKREFEQMVAGEDGWSEWVHPRPGYLMACCGCGLVHEMEVAIAVPGAETLAGSLNAGEGAAKGVVVFRMRRSEVTARPTVEGEGWKPISTFPDDLRESEELAWLCTDGPEAVPMVGSWDNEDQRFYTFNLWLESMRERYGRVGEYEPAHWRRIERPCGSEGA